MNELERVFIDTLVSQIRALDQFGSWDNKSNEELLLQKYVKSKDDLKKIPIIADIDEMQIKDIRLIFQAVALAFEKKTNIMCNVVMEMSHEGFGRAIVIADKIVITDKYFKDAHRYSFRSYEKLVEEGGKMVERALKIYKEIKK